MSDLKYLNLRRSVYMIPETKINVVKKALQETFGVSEFEDIRKLTAGLTCPTSLFSCCLPQKANLLI